MTSYLGATAGTTAARLVATSDLGSATYSNGNGGVGAILTATSNGALEIDGVTPSVNDIVLLTAQSNAYENGPYGVNQVGNSGAPFILQRAFFFQNPVQVTGGSFIPIGAGASGKGQIWVLVEPLPVVMGTDAIHFIQS
jgi:hypothetical protein